MIVDLIILALIGICIFLGAKRGLVLSLISALSLVIALMLGYLLMPVVGGVLARTPLATSTEQTVYTYVSEAVTSEEGYEKALAKSELPGFLQDKVVDILAESHKQDAVEQGVRKAAKTVADLVVKATSILLVAVITWIVLLSVKSIWKGIRKMPVLHQVDTIGGIAFGLCQGVLIVSTVMLGLSLFGTGGIGGTLMNAIQTSYVGGFFYSHNFLGLLIGLFVG
ncbi:MAG: CvpA family protein [Clostridia bacterium]|nr:CvpA family protein [Clostridia bacterium]